MAPHPVCPSPPVEALKLDPPLHLCPIKGLGLSLPMGLCVFCEGRGLVAARPGTESLDLAVIVIRHFSDIDGDASNYIPGPFCYQMPSGSPVETPWGRLNDQGIGASVNYGQALPGFVQSLSLSPIGRVITQDPHSRDETQNPFASLYPLIFDLKLTDVELLPNGEALLEKDIGSLLRADGQHSTIISCTKQVLWGDQTFDEKLFLGKLRRGILPSLNKRPRKAPDAWAEGIYVFTNYSSVDKKFDLKIYPTFTRTAPPPPGPSKGAC
mmetsp:Transcript_53326/g.86242  ORF Transcript_53326/g.86242 Transcript_53326/m.86242 type:complete len:268 (+) Transcript_53326:3-806(+)